MLAVLGVVGRRFVGPARVRLLRYTLLVTAEAERLLDAAMQLTDAERAELAAILADSVGDGASPTEVDTAWIAEAKRRLEDIRSGNATSVPWEDVSRKLRGMVARARGRDDSAR